MGRMEGGPLPQPQESFLEEVSVERSHEGLTRRTLAGRTEDITGRGNSMCKGPGGLLGGQGWVGGSTLV